MHDFPPRIDAYTRAEAARPDTRSPARFLLWTLRVQVDVLMALSIAGLAWFLPSALSPFLLGRTIDAGILLGDWTATVDGERCIEVSLSQIRHDKEEDVTIDESTLWEVWGGISLQER